MGAKSLFTISVSLLNPKILKGFERLGEDFEKELLSTFRSLVFDIHKYLIRITPIDTGELRGGWTAFLDANQKEYSRQILDTGLAIKARGQEFHISSSAIAKGKTQSAFVDQTTRPENISVTLINSVPHGFFLEHGTSTITGRNFVSMARYKGELRFTSAFNEWFNQIAKAGKVVPFKSSDEDITS